MENAIEPESTSKRLPVLTSCIAKRVMPHLWKSGSAKKSRSERTRKNGDDEKSKDERKRQSDGMLKLKHAQQTRDSSRKLNDAAVAAVRVGDNQTAMRKWVEAAKADPTFSGPPFNMARFMLDKGARRPDELIVVEKYLDAAERNALKSSDGEDSRILEQLPTLRQWLASRKNTFEI